MGHRVLGLISFCVGFGMLLAVLVPAFGWALAVAFSLLGLGYYLTKKC